MASTISTWSTQSENTLGVTYTHPFDVRSGTDDVTMTSSSMVTTRFKPWDNPDNVIDQDTSHVIVTVVNIGLLQPLVIAGVVANILNMLIFARQGLRDRINVCLFSLALADCGYLLALFTYKSFSLLSLVSPSLGDYWKVRSLNTVIGVFWGFSTTSNLLTLLVALERCLCVVSPLRAKQMLKTKVMVVIIVIIYFVVLSSSLIFNVKFKVGTTEYQNLNPDTNTTTTTVHHVAVLSDFYLHNKVFVDVVYNYVLAIALPFSSLVVVVFSTAITVVCLQRALAWKASVNVSAVDKKETAVTKMLLIVCYVYVLCVTPSVVNAFVVQFVDGWLPTERYSNLFYVYVALMHLLTAVNSSVNFVIYYSRGSRFRASLGELCCRKGRKKAPEPHSMMSTVYTTGVSEDQSGMNEDEY